MLKVEEREVATRLFEDMADSRSGKLDDEMTELRLWRPGHLLEAGTSHRSSSRLTSGVRSFEVKIKPSDALVHDQSARILIDELVECHRTPFWLELDGDREPFTCSISGPSSRACQPDRGAIACGHRQVLDDRKSTRLNSSHVKISYAVFCLKKKNTSTS